VSNKPLATHEQKVWVFPEDPFADKAEWLKGLKLHLYEPPGATNKLLTAAKRPFERKNQELRLGLAAGVAGGEIDAERCRAGHTHYPR
jgi:hypothetical protein